MLWFKVIICVVFGIITEAAAAGCGFGYDGELGKSTWLSNQDSRVYSSPSSHVIVQGPDHWGDEYEECLGKHQSPINIDSAHVTRVRLPPLKMYGFKHTLDAATLTNNGHTAMMTTDSQIKPILSGGPLKGNYEFAQLHFHWGSEDAIGSEDEIDGKTYPMEMHLVFFKQEYLNSDAAMAHSDGLSVVAVFFEVGDIHNHKYDGFAQVLEKIIDPETSDSFDEAPALLDLMPHDLTHYFTYNGSLTTPPCSEVVTWIDFKEPVKLSHDQFQGFRDLLNEEQNSMSNNFRSIQPLGDRVVLYNTNRFEDKFEHLKEELEADIEKLRADTEALVEAVEEKANNI